MNSCTRFIGMGTSVVWVTAAACEQVEVHAVTELPGPPDATSAPTGDPPVDEVYPDPTQSPPPQSTDATDENTDATDEDTDATVADGGQPEPSARSPGCSGPVLPPGDTSLSLQVGDLDRSYVLHVPPAYDGREAVPLIVDFHGIGASGWSELLASPYPAVTDAEGVIMAFPDGIDGPLGSAWNMGPCCVADVDDVAFARALVNAVSSTACIDPTRVYAVGVLTGGGMVQHLACHAADVFAAVAPAAFDLLQETVADCNPSRPITVMSFRGTEDARVPYAGGPSAVVPGMPITFLGAQGSLQKWAELNDCVGALSNEDSNGCAFYSGCADEVDVALCTAHGGGEAPADATLAWPVLRRHRLR